MPKHDPGNKLMLLGIQQAPLYLDSLEGEKQLSGSNTPRDLDELWDAELSGSQLIVIRFESSADGRGFSLARHLRLRLGYQGKLYVAGDIIPDQVSMALDCGFDAVVVDAGQQDSYGERNWLDSLGRPGRVSYWSNGDSRENRAWERRAVVTGSPAHL